MSRSSTSGNMGYDRKKAVDYARKWALKRNPKYFNFSGLGGDCANFASQCLYAGGGVMNYKPLFGWYYNSASDRTPSWSGVQYLYNFLTGNDGPGPYASEIGLKDLHPGDIIQLSTYLPEYHHTLVVSETGEVPDYENTLICAHTYDSLDRPLASYEIHKIRFLQIDGIR